MSHKLFSKLFKTTKSFWCFVFVTLFNLQGAHRANLSRRILMIAHRFPFVKNFFQVFSNFFVLSFAGSQHYPSPAFRKRLDYVTTGFRTCQALFPSFPNFFQRPVSLFTCSICTFRGAFRPLAKRLLILANTFSFVNTFF